MYWPVPADYCGVLPTHLLSIEVCIPTIIACGYTSYRHHAVEIVVRHNEEIIYLHTPTPLESGWVESSAIQHITPLLITTASSPPLLGGVFTPFYHNITSEYEAPYYTIRAFLRCVSLGD